MKSHYPPPSRAMLILCTIDLGDNNAFIIHRYFLSLFLFQLDLFLYLIFNRNSKCSKFTLLSSKALGNRKKKIHLYKVDENGQIYSLIVKAYKRGYRKNGFHQSFITNMKLLEDSIKVLKKIHHPNIDNLLGVRYTDDYIITCIWHS